MLENIIIRIPSIPHEKGYDSFFIHILSNSISIFGEARWWVNWLSIFGDAPASYASAVPFTLSGISQVTGLEMEKVILIFCIFIGLFGMCTAFVFAGKICNNFLFKFLVSLVFSLAPGFMLFTTWEVSTRGQFISFLPLFLYILLNKELKLKKLLLLIICIVFIFSTHHFGILLLPIIVIYISLKCIQKLKPAFLEHEYFNYMLLVLFVVSLLIPFFTGMFIDAGSRYTWILNAIITNIRQAGILVLLLPGSLFYIFPRKKKFELTFMCLTLIMLAPTFYSQTYGPFILVFFCSFLIVIGLNNLIKVIINSSSNKLLLFIFVVMILFFVAFGDFFNHYRTGSSSEVWYMKDNTYESAKWAKNFIPENTHGLDSGMETERFFAISEGHPITVSLDPANLAYGWINKSSFRGIDDESASDFFTGSSLLVASGFSDRMDWLKEEGGKAHLDQFFDYCVEDKKDPKPIFKYLKSNYNLIFDGPQISIWKISA